MGLTPTLATGLTLLSEALGDPDVDLRASLEALAGTVCSAVPSCIGMTVRVIGVAPGLRFTFWGVEGAEPDPVPAAGSSVVVPMTSGPAPRAEIVLYAATPGAFVDLAADLSVLTSTPLPEVVVDRHLDGACRLAQSTDVGRLVDASVVEQAVGALLGRGWTHEEARQALGDRAGGHGPVAVAEELLDNLAQGTPGWWVDPD